MTVSEIQKALKASGFDPGPLDGIMGFKTRAAIKEFQRSVAITADGIVGPVTMAALVKTGLVVPVPVPKPGYHRTTRSIHTLVWHCTATYEGKEHTVAQIDSMHRARGFAGIGYHGLVHLDGKFSPGRAISKIGSHVAGHNTGTIGYAYVGGVIPNPKDASKPIAKDTRTEAQKATMLRLTKEAADKYKLRAVVGHRDLSPDLDKDGVIEPWEWVKMCPCFNVIPEYGHLLRRD